MGTGAPSSSWVGLYAMQCMLIVSPVKWMQLCYTVDVPSMYR